jgi:hypothetical protein
MLPLQRLYLLLHLLLHLPEQLPASGGRRSGRFLQMLPLSTGAACLDGSPYGYYLSPSHSNSTRWVISIQGGGWCGDEGDCLGRSNGDLGSSRRWGNGSVCYPGGGWDPQLVTGDSSCIYMPYCDGASFSGFREEAWPARYSNGTNASLHFRGARNMAATLDAVIQDHGGFANATEVLVVGTSAGGLSMLLHLDRIAALVTGAAPGAMVRGVSDAGFFLDHPTWDHSASHSFPSEMEYIYSMQQLKPNLDASCLAGQKAMGAPMFHCFMAPHIAPFIQTPYFLTNSKYDAFQLSSILVEPCCGHNPPTCNATDVGRMNAYSTDFVAAVTELASTDTFRRQNGAYLTSCVCHNCAWSLLNFSQTSVLAAMTRWYTESLVMQEADYDGLGFAGAHVSIDPRGLNGDGALAHTASCQDWLAPGVSGAAGRSVTDDQGL